MTVETKLAELEAQKRELLRTPCAACGHPFALHGCSCTPVCNTWTHRPPCGCRGFVETTDEQLALT